MTIDISTASLGDLDAIDSLMKANSETLGFLPRVALCEYVRNGGVLVAKDSKDTIVGYLLYGENQHYFRLAHLCVAGDSRGKGIASKLVEALKGIATTQRIIRLHCRRDFTASKLWPRLGFLPLEEKQGRSVEGHLLTLWCLTLTPNDQLSLFQARVSDEGLDAVIDAQVFFDFEETFSEKGMPSKALLSDSLAGMLRLYITDEMFNEINRNNNNVRRKSSRERAHMFSQVHPDSDLVSTYDSMLRPLFPRNPRPSDESDVRQLAKAAASDASIFVTRDRDLLAKGEAIKRLLNLDVISPTNLLIRLHEVENRHSYMADMIAGSRLRWQRLSSNDLATVLVDPFLAPGERKGTFTTRLESLVSSNLSNCWCDLLWSDQEVIAIRVMELSSDDVLSVRLGRVSQLTRESELISRFIATDALARAIDLRMIAVQIAQDAGVTDQASFLTQIGFVENGDNLIRYCFSQSTSRASAIDSIRKTSPLAVPSYLGVSANDLSRLCSPIHLECADEEYFLIPIRPGYALSLVDRHASANDLFGGVRDVLLRWDNIYYRSKDRQHMLKPPARILWYVSGDVGQIVAVSHLDSVEVDSATRLFRKYAKFGILEWRDIFAMCKGDPEREIMALEFSHTFSFRSPVSLTVLRRVYDEEDRTLVLRSPSRVTRTAFRRIFQLGFGEKS